MKRILLALIVALMGLTGCNYEDVPTAHRGRVFEKRVFGESHGFLGDVLSPGTHDVGVNNELHLVQCGETTVRESFTAPSKNGVVFGADVYVRFATNCDDSQAVKWVLDNVRPGTFIGDAPKQAQTSESDAQRDNDRYDEKTISSAQLFATYVRPALGMSVRDALSAYQSDEINLKRQEIAAAIDAGLRQRVSESAGKVQILNLSQVDLSNIAFPESMRGTMEQLANVKTEVELEKERTKKIDQQIVSENRAKELAKVQAQKSSTEIEEIGNAVRHNPEYLTFLRLQAETDALRKTPDAIGKLGGTPGTVILGDSTISKFLTTGAAK